MCLNKPVKVEMTGRDEGCGRCAALRAAARLCRNSAIARGSHAPSPSQASGARNSGATRQKRVQSYRNRTATPGEELHQIAPNCTKLHQKIKKEETRAETRYSALFIAPIFLPAKWQRRPASCGESSAAGRRCHHYLPGRVCYPECFAPAEREDGFCRLTVSSAAWLITLL
jgi:hypothetical protein